MNSIPALLPLHEFALWAFPLLLTLHVLGVVLGMGGATAADMLFFSFLQDFKITKKEAGVLHALSRLVLAAIIVISISGFLLFMAKPTEYGTSPMFLAKMYIVGILIINGYFLHRLVMPHMVSVSFASKKPAKPKLHRLRRLSFALGAVSVSSWYMAFFIAMLKGSIFAGWDVASLMSLYAFVLIGGVVGSQVTERFFHRRALLGMK